MLAVFYSLLSFSPVSSFALGNITLAWDPSPDTSVASYRIYYGSASGVYTNSIATGAATTITVSNLTEGVLYYFAATSVNTNNLESVFSTEASGMVSIANKVPTLNPISNVSINEDSGIQAVNLSGISSGATNESQTLFISASSSNPSLIPNPTVNYASPNSTGSLTFTPTAALFGVATITVTVNDGGASNNTASRTFTVTVNAVNDQPTLSTIANVTINEDSGSRNVNLAGISSGATNENQTLTITATSSNPSLISNPAINYTSPGSTGSLSFTPAASAFGSATITVTVNDGGVNNNSVSRSFTVTVNSVNDSPTLNTLINTSLNEDAGVQIVNLGGISSGAANESQTLTISAISSNPTLIPNPTVSYTSPNATGSLSFTPAADAFGSATISVTVNDGGTSSNTIVRSFTVAVNSVNDSPTLNTLANVSLNQDAGVQIVNLSGISSGAANENQALVVTATSSNPSLIPTPTLTYTSPNSTGSLAFTPVVAAFGTATITVAVNDGGASNNTVSRSFTVTVNQVNQAPFISAITNRTIAVNSSTPLIPFTISDVDSPAASLTLSVSSDNPLLVPGQGLLLSGSGNDRFLTVTPTSGQTGVALITISVDDGMSASTSSFQLIVNPRPPAPSNLRVTLQ